MGVSGRYSSISVIEISITTFANEGYSVKYDFAHKLLCWRDYYMWNNNFMRAINDEMFDMLVSNLPKLKLLEWMESYNNGNESLDTKMVAFSGEWKIRVQFDDKTVLTSEAEQYFPKLWCKLKCLVEKTSGSVFSIR